MNRLAAAGSALMLVAVCGACRAEGLRSPAWETPLHEVTGSEPIGDLLMGCKWTGAGWPGSKATVSTGASGLPGKSLGLETRVEHSAGIRANFDARLSPNRDWSDHDGIRFSIRAYCSDPETVVTLRLIINEETQMKLHLPAIKTGDTRTVILPFGEDRRGALKKVSLLRFFLSGNEYSNGTGISLRMWNFELVKLRKGYARLPKNEAGIELFSGDESKVAIVPFGGALPKCRALVYSGMECPLQPTDVLACTATELFSGKNTSFEQPLERAAAAGQRSEFAIKLPSVAPGYYWVTCDLKRGQKSLVGSRVGFADFYQQAKDESMTHTILSLRTGMGLYIIDPAGGYGYGSIVLMHTYDPRDESHYVDFIKAYQHWSPEGASTSKDTEVLEAGVAGTVFAATAFRAAGDLDRARFTEKLLKSNCDYMIDYMQKPDGSTKWDVNEFYSRHLGEYRDGATDARVPDTNQIGEWLRAISRAMIYFKDVPGEQAYVDRLYKAALKSADYLVRVSTDQIGNRKHVIRHFILVDEKYPGGRRELYHQEGRQCDVYLPRAMAGLSYFAYVRQLREKSVPQSYLDALRDTTEWALEKMTSDTNTPLGRDFKSRPIGVGAGWFDWQCGYEVEGGCHSFLGNQYLAEATQGYYLLCAARGDVEGAKLAAECTKRALHWVTDHDRFTANFKGAFEFWVGPYLYWQFTEYLGSIGDDPAFSDFLKKLHSGWAEKRNWQDFTQRTGKSIVDRANELSNIHQSILAYPALRLMEEMGKPFRYDVKRLGELSAPAK